MKQEWGMGNGLGGGRREENGGRPPALQNPDEWLVGWLVRGRYCTQVCQVLYAGPACYLPARLPACPPYPPPCPPFMTT